MQIRIFIIALNVKNANKKQKHMNKNKFNIPEKYLIEGKYNQGCWAEIITEPVKYTKEEVLKMINENFK